MKLTLNYGGLISAILLIFIILNFFIITNFKNKGIDASIQQSIENIEHNIREFTHKSVEQYLKVENEKLSAISVEYLNLAEKGLVNREEVVEQIVALISNSPVGESGYSYALNLEGEMTAHPVEEYIGRDFSWDEGIQKQLLMKEGVLKYDWKNPDDINFRKKILYMSYCEPLAWIISTTAYTDDQYTKNLRLEDIRSIFENQNLNSLCCISLMNGSGDFILSTESPNEDNEIFRQALYERFDDIRENVIGHMTIYVNSPQRGESRAVAFYSYLPEMDWVIVGMGYQTELYRQVINSYMVMATAIIIAFVLFVVLNNRISSHITAPLSELVEKLDKSTDGDFSVRLNIKTGDEFEIVSEHFNRFMKSHQENTKRIEQARSEIKTLAKFPDETPSPVIRLDSSQRIEYANKEAVASILNPLNLAVGDTVPDESLTKFMNTNTFTGRNEFEINGKIFSFSASRINDPACTYLYGKDISRQKKFESIQLLSENIFRNSIEGIVITNSKGIIESVNPAFTKITGYSAEEAIGQTPRILKSHRHSKDFYSDLWGALRKKGYWSGEIWNRRKNGIVYAELLTINSIRNDEGEIIQFISFFHDLSDVKEKEARIIYESMHDKLTGLPNREFLISLFPSLVENAESDGECFSLVYIDINNFKRINESAGAEAGDLLLLEVSDRLRVLFSSEDDIIRMGSDEFICIVRSDRDQNETSSIADSILKIFGPAFYVADHEINLEISIGISRFPDDDNLPLELLAKAEAAMRDSKRNINSPYTFYSPSLRQDGLSRIEIESALRTAFENRQFYLNYQPKVSASDGKIIGAEALVRLKPVEGQFIGPDVFIPIAEEIGLIEPLGAWVLEMACRDTVRLINNGFSDINIAVNLSPWQFRNVNLPEQVRNIIESTGIPPANLNLEITESMAIDNVNDSIKAMNSLTEIGLSLSIDDFGTGYSSLSYLSQFPVDILKIDKAFVDGIPEDSKRTGVVLAILSLAKNLGMKTVAEGVETIEHSNFLKKHGCTQFQGYYYHKPLLLEDFEEVLGKEV